MDGDGLQDCDEAQYGLDPNNPDEDGDGLLMVKKLILEVTH